MFTNLHWGGMNGGTTVSEEGIHVKLKSAERAAAGVFRQTRQQVIESGSSYLNQH